jgi:hypothetical protein
VFKRYYSDRFREVFGAPPRPDEGLGDDAVRIALARRDLVIPTALRDYYSLAGRHRINENHDRLRPVEELEWMGDKLVFLDENQCVVFWGIDRSDLKKADPIAWQGINGTPIEWHSENLRLSRFLMARWRWIVTGEEPELAFE